MNQLPLNRRKHRALKNRGSHKNKGTFNGLPVQIIQMEGTHKVIRHTVPASDGKYKPVKIEA